MKLNSFVKQELIVSLEEVLNLSILILDKQSIDQRSFQKFFIRIVDIDHIICRAFYNSKCSSFLTGFSFYYLVKEGKKLDHYAQKEILNYIKNPEELGKFLYNWNYEFLFMENANLFYVQDKQLPLVNADLHMKKIDPKFY